MFPPIYVTSVLAGEKSGALGEVLDRFITYQKLALAVRKKLLLSLIYPTLADRSGDLPDGVPGHLRGAEFRRAVQQHVGASCRWRREILIAVGTTARSYILVGFVGADRGGDRVPLLGENATSGQERMDRWRLRTPVLGEIWIKYQVAQFSRVLGTLLVGGIPLLQALDTAANSLGTQSAARRRWRSRARW